jgi:hypothetical protein
MNCESSPELVGSEPRTDFKPFLLKSKLNFSLDRNEFKKITEKKKAMFCFEKTKKTRTKE